MTTKALNQLFGLWIKRPGELHFLEKCHLEDLVRVLSHERWSTISELIDHDAECIPVRGLRVTGVFDDFWCHVLWGPTERVGSLVLLQSFDEPQISQLEKSVIRY